MYGQRKAIESLYDRTAEVYHTVKERRLNGSTRLSYQPAIPAFRCRLSYSKTTTTDPTETVAVVSQAVTLFCAPELEILPGATVKVTKNGKTEEYKSAGKAAVYDSHQEIPLVLSDTRA